MDENEFEEFVSQLFSEEFPSFQAIEGSGGDGGLDGLDGKTVFQMYFPEPKNRNKRNYLKKIDESITKLQATMEKESLLVERWVLVVPEDLSASVVTYLSRKSSETGIELLHWGATKLGSLLSRHPHIRDNFPEVFLPDMKSDLVQVKLDVQSLRSDKRYSSDKGVEILTDDEFDRLIKDIDGAFASQLRAAQIRFANSSTIEPVSRALQTQANQKRQEVRNRKEVSDRFYELEREDILAEYDQRRDQTISLFKTRNLYPSGLADAAVTKVNAEQARELDKLQLKYGKKHNSVSLAA